MMIGHAPHMVHVPVNMSPSISRYGPNPRYQCKAVQILLAEPVPGYLPTSLCCKTIPTRSANVKTKICFAICLGQGTSDAVLPRLALPFGQLALAHHLERQRNDLRAWFAVFRPNHFLAAHGAFRDTLARLGALLFPGQQSFHETCVAEYMT